MNYYPDLSFIYFYNSLSSKPEKFENHLKFAREKVYFANTTWKYF